METSRKPKILQISTYFHPSVGGVERQAEEIAVHLKDLGYEVEVVTTDATHGRERRMQRLEDSLRGLKIKRFRYLLALGNFWRLAPGLLWYVIKADYDIIHLHNIHDGHLLPIILIKAFRRKKLVVTGHNPFVVNALKRGGVLHSLVGFFEFVLRFFSWGIDRYIALLESEKVQVQKHIGIPAKKVAVVPNGIQELFFEDNGDKQRFYQTWQINPENWKLIVGSVCRLNMVKGLQNLAQATRDLPEVLFVFAGGDDGYLAALRKIFALSPNVLITEEYLPAEEVKDFYQSIDIFLLPSLYEPFGMTVVEAMAQGRPVIASNLGGPSEIVAPTVGDLLDPQDQKAWSERIGYYVEHRDELASKSAQARMMAAQYQWGTVIRQISDVYDSLR